LFAGCAQRLLQQPEIRPALFIKHDRLAIDDHRRRSERSGGLYDRRKAVRPVMAAAGENPYPLRLDVNSEAIAIPFQLPAPLVSLWGTGLQLRQRRFDAVWHGIEQELWLGWISLPAGPGTDRGLGVTKEGFWSRRLRHADSSAEKS